MLTCIMVGAIVSSKLLTVTGVSMPEDIRINRIQAFREINVILCISLICGCILGKYFFPFGYQTYCYCYIFDLDSDSVSCLCHISARLTAQVLPHAFTLLWLIVDYKILGVLFMC